MRKTNTSSVPCSGSSPACHRRGGLLSEKDYFGGYWRQAPWTKPVSPSCLHSSPWQIHACNCPRHLVINYIICDGNPEIKDHCNCPRHLDINYIISDAHPEIKDHEDFCCHGLMADGKGVWIDRSSIRSGKSGYRIASDLVAEVSLPSSLGVV